jgi:hypothetical protein
MGNKIYVKNPNRITLYHGTGIPPEKILKDGLIPPPGGEEFRGKSVIFMTPIRSMAEDFYSRDRYLYKINYDVDLKTAKRVRNMLHRIRVGKETTDNDADIMEFIFESVDPSDIKLVKKESRKKK